jgi:hypothetical protein
VCVCVCVCVPQQEEAEKKAAAEAAAAAEVLVCSVPCCYWMPAPIEMAFHRGWHPIAAGQC